MSDGTRRQQPVPSASSSRRDVDLYASLPDRVRDAPIVQGNNPPVGSSSSSSDMPFAETLAHSAAGSKVATKEYGAKLKGKQVPLDNPPRQSKEKKRKALQKSRRHGVRGMTAKERRETKIYDVPKACEKYELFVPLNQLWVQYMDELLQSGSRTPVQFAAKLLKADFHGAILTVSKSRCPSYVGISGICIKETENMFILIAKDDAKRSIPKGHSVFTFEVRGTAYSLYGDQFRYRSAVRATKKFKMKPTIDL